MEEFLFNPQRVNYIVYPHMLFKKVIWFIKKVLPKYQPKRGGDLGWGKFFRFKCGIKNYLQIANVWSQFNCNIDMIWNQAQVYI